MIPKTAVLAAQASAESGEGPIWDHRCNKLLWLDISNHILHIHNPETGKNSSEKLPERISRLFLMGDNEYGAIVAGGVARLYKKDGIWACERLITLDKNPDIVSNDGECDSRGRLVVGLMHKDLSTPAGSLHLVNGNTHTCFRRDLKIPNGVAWSTDEKDLYIVTNTPKTGLLNYEYNPETGTVGELKELIEFPGADGMCADCDGNLWITLCGRGAVVCFNPKTKEITKRIEIPVKTCTSCAIGGKDMNTLFITSATWGNTVPEAPLRGSLFKAENIGARGKKSNLFKYREA